MRALVKETNVLFGYDDSSDEGPLYSLINQDLTQIKPNYEAMIKQGQLKVTDMGIQHGKQGLKHGKCCVFFLVSSKINSKKSGLQSRWVDALVIFNNYFVSVHL